MGLTRNYREKKLETPVSSLESRVSSLESLETWNTHTHTHTLQDAPAWLSIILMDCILWIMDVVRESV